MKELTTKDVLTACAVGLFVCMGWWPITWVIGKLMGWC